MNLYTRLVIVFFLVTVAANSAVAQPSAARRWNEVLLQAIRLDYAQPPVHARNLFHFSIAAYDAWAVYDSKAETYLLGKTVGNYTCPFAGVGKPENLKAAREMALSYAVYRLLKKRFAFSPHARLAYASFDSLMQVQGYDIADTTTDYRNGSPAALGNYIARNLIEMGLADGSYEIGNYGSSRYQSVNFSMLVNMPGNQRLVDPNRWQPLALGVDFDQHGLPVPATQIFMNPEWGQVQPFAMTPADKTVHERRRTEFFVYNDPGPMPLLDTVSGGSASDEYKWNFELVAAWSAHLDPTDGVLWDISPGARGNLQSYPQNWTGLHDFFDFKNGGDHSTGRKINPRTGKPYPPQIVPRGDYTRALTQFWTEGPNSTTTPVRWYVMLNQVADQAGFKKRFKGKGPEIDNLEWDVKAYFALGGAMHDATICAWSAKGWYDGIRPISALRYMADKGQGSDPALPGYHPAGLRLYPGLIELIQNGDALAGPDNRNVGKIKIKAFRGPDAVRDPASKEAGVGWILAAAWWPYQQRTVVTPPYGGYVSGYSTCSRAAAEVLTLLTGDEYFPGGMSEFLIPANSGFAGLEKGPSVDVKLQWATYRDAADQASLAQIWGGIHAPFDDIPGRVTGAKVGAAAFKRAESYFSRSR